MARKKNIAKSFEDALAKLEAIVEQIEEGQVGLEESILKYEEGMALVKYCRDVLSSAEERIQKLQESADGDLRVSDFEAERDGPADETNEVP